MRVIDLGTSIAHAVLERAAVLIDERRNRDARYLVDTLLSPLSGNGNVGSVPVEPEPFSHGALVRERAHLRLANLALREGRAGALAEARELLAIMLERVGPEATSPTLDGETRMQFLSDLSAAFSRSGQEDTAIVLSEFIITASGAPAVDPASIANYIETGAGGRSRVLVTLQLQYDAIRRLRLAQLELLADRRESAHEYLARAEAEIRIALQAAVERQPREEHDRPRHERIVRVRRAVLARIELEQTVLRPANERRATLRRIRGDLEQIVAETDTSGTTRAAIRLLRHAALAAVICEQALDAESADDVVEARALGQLAYILSAPYVALHEHDADELFAYVFRYAHACRLVGRRTRAEAVIRRTRERLSLFYGERHPALAGIDGLLRQLDIEA